MNRTLKTCLRRAGDTGPSVDMLNILCLPPTTDRQPYVSKSPTDSYKNEITGQLSNNSSQRASAPYDNVRTCNPVHLESSRPKTRLICRNVDHPNPAISALGSRAS